MVTKKAQEEGQSHIHNRLQAISVLDGRYNSDVEALSPFVSEFALIKTRTEVEAKYLMALSGIGILRDFTIEEKDLLTNIGSNMILDQVVEIKEIEKKSEHDVKAVEIWLRNYLSNTTLADVTPYIHFLLTSEDINNLSNRLMLQRGTQEVILPAVDSVIDRLLDFAEKEKATVMPARTHGQDAVPTTLGKELAAFAVRMNEEVRKLEQSKLTGKFNGAAGNYNAHKYARPDVDWLKFSKDFVESLGLKFNPFSTQINPYEDMIEMFQTYERLNGVFLDMDQDMWRYISDNWFAQEVKAEETGSSTMPQKVNPIKFENSEGNVSVANSLFEGFSRKLATSRLQRDLSDSTTIRNVGTALGHSLLIYRNALQGLGRISVNHQEIEKALNKNWSILTEGVQSVLRDHGKDNAYEVVKAASRGKEIGPENWEEWVERLDATDEEKQQFKKLSPLQYIGMAMDLADLAIATIEDSRNN